MQGFIEAGKAGVAMLLYPRDGHWVGEGIWERPQKPQENCSKPLLKALLQGSFQLLLPHPGYVSSVVPFSAGCGVSVGLSPSNGAMGCTWGSSPAIGYMES